MVAHAIVDEPYPRRVAQQRARLLGSDPSLAFDCYRDCMRPQYRHADAGYSDPDFRIGEDLAHFLDDLGLFDVVPGRGVDWRVVAEQVEGIGVRKRSGRMWLASEVSPGGVEQLLHCRGTAARSRLIGGKDRSSNTAVAVDLCQWHQGDGRGAVWVGDDATVGCNR